MTVFFTAAHLNNREPTNGSRLDGVRAEGFYGSERDGAARAGDTATGQLIHTWRIRALLTQEELAARAGLSVRTVRRLERTRSAARPRLTSIRLLAEALNLSDAERTALASLSHGSLPAEPLAHPACTVEQHGVVVADHRDTDLEASAP
ncbi:MAG TPA: helix-turn-helix transcriptional regulator [Pseudonocardia sp.]|nr:helix-turn-helix transcriptional regulator [Pseudonocardia sp.]